MTSTVTSKEGDLLKWPIAVGSEQVPYRVERTDIGARTTFAIFLDRQKLGEAVVERPSSREEGTSYSLHLVLIQSQKSLADRVVRGAGTVLMKEVISFSWDDGFDGRVDWISRDSAIPFYLKLGAYPTSWLDRLLIQRSLPVLFGFCRGRRDSAFPETGCQMVFSDTAIGVWKKAMREGAAVLTRDRDALIQSSGFSPKECSAYNIQRIGRGFLKRKACAETQRQFDRSARIMQRLGRGFLQRQSLAKMRSSSSSNRNNSG